MVQRTVKQPRIKSGAGLLLAALCCVFWAVTCYAQTRLGPLGPGLACNPTTYNPGTAPVTADCPLTPQLFEEDHSSSCVINSTCGSANDSGKLLTATASITFTLPAPGAAGSAGYMFGYDGSHSYTLTTTGGTIYGGCGNGTATASALALQVMVVPSSSGNWQCVPYGGGAAAAPVAIAFNAAADLANNGGTGTSYTKSYTVGSGSSRFLLVMFQGDVVGGSDDITSVTYGGVAMTQMLKNTAGVSGTNRVIYFYGLANPASGANNVVVSYSAAHYIIMQAADYTGVTQGTPACDGSGVNNVNTNINILGLTFTPTATGDWGLGYWAWAGNFTYTADTGFVQRTVGAAFGAPVLFDSNTTMSVAAHTVTATASGNESVNGMICGLKHG
jgi:hypothetical protein